VKAVVLSSSRIFSNDSIIKYFLGMRAKFFSKSCNELSNPMAENTASRWD
jgi:hypothetical protein